MERPESSTEATDPQATKRLGAAPVQPIVRPRTRSFHVGLSVRGALNWPKSEMNRLAKSMLKPDGTPMNPTEARDALMDELSKGHEIVPFGDSCDNWDWKDGCQGHDVVA